MTDAVAALADAAPSAEVLVGGVAVVGLVVIGAIVWLVWWLRRRR